MLAENWKDFIKPSNISYNEKNNKKDAKIIVEPLERGFGITVGNSLRRVLLSSIYGTAFTALKIEGVIHEQDAVKGVSEDITDIVFNLKRVVLRSDVLISKKVSVDIEGPCQVTAGMLSIPQDIEVINPDQVICNIDNNSRFKAELTIESGKGYRDSAMIANENKEIGVINIDAVFSPIRRVSFVVDSSRVGERIDYDKLILNVETNGSIEAGFAVGIAAKIMKEQMTLFIDFDENIQIVGVNQEEEEVITCNPLLVKKVDDLELSVRSQNCLKNEGIFYLGDLVKRTENDMLRTPNFGRKSLNEIKAILQSMDLNFGMEVDNWPPENIEQLAKTTEN
jgi:DNA-directed RNA polymerase subunit alpha